MSSDQSLHFPDIPIADVLPDYLEQSLTTGRTTVMRAFRRWVREQLG